MKSTVIDLLEGEMTILESNTNSYDVELGLTTLICICISRMNYSAYDFYTAIVKRSRKIVLNWCQINGCKLFVWLPYVLCCTESSKPMTRPTRS